MIDSHCHLDRLDLSSHQDSLANALNSAREQGVKGFLCIGIGFANAKALLDLQRQQKDVWLAMGVHPLNDELAVEAEQLQHWCSMSEVVAVGETGLDYHYKPETADAQIQSFATHLQVADDLNKPVVVHTRSAEDDTLALIRNQNARAAGILHCFTESWQMAEQALALGYYVSISGIVTFHNAENVREVAKKIPLERLLIETDSPYLAPVPYRGKPNEPAYLPRVAECIADIRAIELQELVAATTANFHRLFPSTRDPEASENRLALNTNNSLKV